MKNGREQGRGSVHWFSLCTGFCASCLTLQLCLFPGFSSNPSTSHFCSILSPVSWRGRILQSLPASWVLILFSCLSLPQVVILPLHCVLLQRSPQSFSFWDPDKIPDLCFPSLFQVAFSNLPYCHCFSLGYRTEIVPAPKQMFACLCTEMCLRMLEGMVM